MLTTCFVVTVIQERGRKGSLVRNANGGIQHVQGGQCGRCTSKICILRRTRLRSGAIQCCLHT